MKRTPNVRANFINVANPFEFGKDFFDFINEKACKVILKRRTRFGFRFALPERSTKFLAMPNCIKYLLPSLELWVRRRGR